jgi:hypothetical protein
LRDCACRPSTGTNPALIRPESTRSVGMNVYFSLRLSCAVGANTAGTCSRSASIDSA